ncbi:MAG: preprotein translocase subunit YajC [Acidobacteriota bacterium]|nr:preprotein translocase subunit YajC [Acidobacteriota bacterium]
MLAPAILFASPSSGAEGLTSFILILGPLILIWYFLVIRPQSSQRRKTQEMLQNLKTGDQIVTTGGLMGTIVGFGSNTVQIQIASQVKVEVVRSAISGFQKKDEPTPAMK